MMVGAATPGRCEGLGRGGVDLEVQELAALESHPCLHHVIRVPPAKQIPASGETAPTIKYPGGTWGGGQGIGKGSHMVAAAQRWELMDCTGEPSERCSSRSM